MKKESILKIIAITGIIALFIAPISLALIKRKTDSYSEIALADWDVTLEQTGINNNLMIVPELATATYTINVKSLSSTDIKYDIVITNLPTGVGASLDATNYTQETNGTITFNNVGTILYNDEDHMDSKTITFRAVTGATFVDNQEVTINVVAKQLIGN